MTEVITQLDNQINENKDKFKNIYQQFIDKRDELNKCITKCKNDRIKYYATLEKRDKLLMKLDGIHYEEIYNYYNVGIYEDKDEDYEKENPKINSIKEELIFLDEEAKKYQKKVHRLIDLLVDMKEITNEAVFTKDELAKLHTEIIKNIDK